MRRRQLSSAHAHKNPRAMPPLRHTALHPGPVVVVFMQALLTAEPSLVLDGDGVAAGAHDAVDEHEYVFADVEGCVAVSAFHETGV